MVPPNPRRTCAHCGEYVGDTLHKCKPAEGTADHDAAAANQFAEKRAKYDTDCRDTRPADWNTANLARAYLEREATAKRLREALAGVTSLAEDVAVLNACRVEVSGSGMYVRDMLNKVVTALDIARKAPEDTK